ncbi:hypothetical protein ACJX0J_039537, partial [Zea mays]
NFHVLGTDCVIRNLNVLKESHDTIYTILFYVIIWYDSRLGLHHNFLFHH